jgi:hypothetical protein
MAAEPALGKAGSQPRQDTFLFARSASSTEAVSNGAFVLAGRDQFMIACG